VSLISELIRKKRDGLELSEKDIGLLINGITTNHVTDAQIAAFTMAVWFKGMSPDELKVLTTHMRDSGEVLQWAGLDGPVMDKHSTGGVGDLVSLVLAAMTAACGAYVPMISGRGLGHTGGTLDKLEAIPGFDTAPTSEKFQSLVKENGLSIIGQTSKLAPADRRIYAVRDVTATVASTPLIVSSILSKKLAEGLDALVMDIKVGSGAFMETLDHARLLAASLCRTAGDAGLACDALLTDMSQPMSWSAGNALEVHEAIAYLTGESRHPRLHEISMGIAGEMLCLGGLATSSADAAARLEAALSSGEAAEKFARMVKAQGGPSDLMDRPGNYLAVAPFSRPLVLEKAAWIESIDMTRLGLAVVKLGGGRLRAEDKVDHAVGLSGFRPVGKFIEQGEEFMTIHARNETEWSDAAEQCKAAIRWTEIEPVKGVHSAILDCVKGKHVNQNG
jgi:thymidine phosphorylase